MTHGPIPITRADDDLVAALRAEVLDLRSALSASRRVGAAIGHLMARRGITHDHALELLTASSRRHGLALADICEHVLSTGDLPPL